MRLTVLWGAVEGSEGPMAEQGDLSPWNSFNKKEAARPHPDLQVGDGIGGGKGDSPCFTDAGLPISQRAWLLSFLFTAESPAPGTPHQYAGNEWHLCFKVFWLAFPLCPSQNHDPSDRFLSVPGFEP